MPRLSELVGHRLDQDVEVTAITADSRAVTPGALFAALPGIKADGRDFIKDALAKGAAAVLAPTGTTVAGVPLVTDDNPRRALSLMAARLHAGQPAVMAAVTGTNGKTSVAHFTRQIWTHAGLAAASLGTIGVTAPGLAVKGSLTTPDPVSLHQCLDELAGSGVTHAAFEASSIGLDQYRVDGVAISMAAFTNLTRDHLDYHGDMDAYWQSKIRLFAEILPPGGTAVINADSDRGPELAALCFTRGQRVITYGTGPADLCLVERHPTAHGQDMVISLFGRVRQLHLPLVGAFQASNAAAALGLALASGITWEKALAGVAALEEVPGRLQKVAQTPAGAPVFVDFAHTPDGLETALSALRPHTASRLVVVFGCGGDRDPGKRPQMGEIAVRLADRVFVTDDNPRSEDPALIRAAIMAAAPGAIEVGDRRQAIRRAVAELKDGDLLVLAGKGHEIGQIIKDKVLPFNDADEARLAVEQLG